MAQRERGCSKNADIMKQLMRRKAKTAKNTGKTHKSLIKTRNLPEIKCRFYNVIQITLCYSK